MKFRSVYRAFGVGGIHIAVGFKPATEKFHQLGLLAELNREPRHLRLSFCAQMLLGEFCVDLTRRWRPATVADIHPSHPMRDGQCRQCYHKMIANCVDDDLRWPCATVWLCARADVHATHQLRHSGDYANGDKVFNCDRCNATYRESIEGDQMEPALLKPCGAP